MYRPLLPALLLLGVAACASTPKNEAVTPTAQPEPTPAEEAEAFKEKIDKKCEAKYPEGSLRGKACVALYMGAARYGCKLADDGKLDELCDKSEKYCTPEVKELVDEALGFCDALTTDEKSD